MGEYRLSRNRQSESGASRLVRDVRIPDAAELARRDAASGIADLDAHSLPAAQVRPCRAYSDPTRAITRVDSVEYHVRQRSRERVVMSDDVRQTILGARRLRTSIPGATAADAAYRTSSAISISADGPSGSLPNSPNARAIRSRRRDSVASTSTVSRSSVPHRGAAAKLRTLLE